MRASDPQHDEAEALRLIKLAHERGGTPLSDAAALAIVEKSLNLGRPEPAKLTAKGQPARPGKSGPKSKRTQYDDALTRGKNLYRKLVTLPNLRKGARGVSNMPEDEIKKLASELKASMPKHKLVSAIRAELFARERSVVPDDSTIRKILRRLAFR